MPVAPIPARLYRNGRSVDSVFAPEERLYLRFPRESYDHINCGLLPSAIRSPVDQSVNRGKYSDPADVLLPHWPDWGIALLEVRDVPKELQSTITYRIRVEHDPLEDNYAHTEIRAYKGDPEARIMKIRSTQVKKEFRTRLSNLARIHSPPP